MTTFEKCKLIRELHVGSFRAEIHNSESFSTEWHLSGASERAARKVATERPDLRGIDPSELTDAECDQLDLYRAEPSSERWVPTWLRPFVVDGIREFVPRK